MLRDALLKRGLSTTDLAERAGLSRADLKRRLAGHADLTIDEFLALAQALELQKDMASLMGADPPAEERPVHSGAESVPAVHTLHGTTAVEDGIDPFGNPARELVRAGFAFGLDMFLHYAVAQIRESGVPESVLARFPDTLPIRLESRWHRHNRAEFREAELQVTLSFDALRTCTLPWSALRSVAFTLPESDAPPPPKPEPEAAASRPVLRLVED
jgi:transcriptional regulator with XRE-family HTH domain